MPQSTTHYAQDALGPYAARIPQFTEAGRREYLTPASSDSEKIAVVLVDYHHDFVDPTGTLYVPGSQADVARFLTWFYANQPALLRKLSFLKDCTSSVQHPVIDFDALAEEKLARMQERGVNIVLSANAGLPLS